MLPQRNRIKKKRDFEIIFKNSRSIKNSFLTFRIRKNNLGLDRFGFVVSLKVSKKATIRNKVRRRMAEAVKAEMKNISLRAKVKIGTDIVLIAMPGIEAKKLFEIKEAIHKICFNL